MRNSLLLVLEAFPDDCLATLMNHSFIINALNALESPVSYLQENYPNIAYVLGETGRFAPAGTDNNLLGVFGSALWTVDYSLWAMTMVRAKSIIVTTLTDTHTEYYTHKLAARNRLRILWVASHRIQWHGARRPSTILRICFRS